MIKCLDCPKFCWPDRISGPLKDIISADLDSHLLEVDNTGGSIEVVRYCDFWMTVPLRIGERWPRWHRCLEGRPWLCTPKPSFSRPWTLFYRRSRQGGRTLHVSCRSGSSNFKLTISGSGDAKMCSHYMRKKSNLRNKSKISYNR